MAYRISTFARAGRCAFAASNILSFEDDPITEAEIVEFVEATATPEQYQQFDETGDLDYAVQAQQFRYRRTA